MAETLAIANRHVGGLESDAIRAAVVESTQLAFWLAAAGILVSLLAVCIPGKGEGQQMTVAR